MNGPKVLIVEDDAPLREALADTLAAAGIDGEAVADAGAALSGSRRVTLAW